MECKEDEAALRSEVRAIRRVTRVVAFKASTACQISIDLTASCSINHPPKVLVTVSYKVLIVSCKSSDRQLKKFWPSTVKFWPSPHWLCHRPFSIHGRHPSSSLPPFMYVYSSPHEHRTVRTMLTVTPIDPLHKSDGSNGVKGVAEEDKNRKWGLTGLTGPCPWAKRKVKPIPCGIPDEIRAQYE